MGTPVQAPSTSSSVGVGEPGPNHSASGGHRVEVPDPEGPLPGVGRVVGLGEPGSQRKIFRGERAGAVPRGVAAQHPQVYPFSREAFEQGDGLRVGAASHRSVRRKTCHLVEQHPLGALHDHRAGPDHRRAQRLVGHHPHRRQGREPLHPYVAPRRVVEDPELGRHLGVTLSTQGPELERYRAEPLTDTVQLPTGRSRVRELSDAQHVLIRKPPALEHRLAHPHAAAAVARRAARPLPVCLACSNNRR